MASGVDARSSSPPNASTVRIRNLIQSSECFTDANIQMTERVELRKEEQAGVTGGPFVGSVTRLWWSERQGQRIRPIQSNRGFAGCGFFDAILRESCFEVPLGGLFVGGYAFRWCPGASVLCCRQGAARVRALCPRAIGGAAVRRRRGLVAEGGWSVHSDPRTRGRQRSGIPALLAPVKWPCGRGDACAV